MASPIVTLMVKREEILMAPARDAKPIYRKAHFLLPSLNVEDTSPTTLIPPHNTISSKNLDVFFDGWRKSTERWEQWVSQMRPLYQTLWERAGIAEAISGSVCTIIQHKEVVLQLSDRWCSETKSFIFPWGEATVTLEDVAVIGGYSLGDYCVLKPLETPDLKEIENMLIMERKVIGRKAARASQKLWMDKFMGTGSHIEHEAFLSFWLSRYVFTGPAIDTIRSVVFPVAIHLSRGTRIALAPAVLASLYRDFDLLKRREQQSARKPSKSRPLNKFTLWAPFQLVQAWIWERFESLRPQGIRTVQISSKPRICRWHVARTEGYEIENISRDFDRSGKTFLWRPYTSRAYKWFMSELYGKKIVRVINTYLHKEALEDFARCIRVSELVGVEVNCIEQYLPHRVAMQFGFDQDIPLSQVDRENSTSVIAWRNYVRPIVDHVIYVPSRLFEPEITTRYYNCWKRSIMIHLQSQTTNRNEVDRGNMVQPVVNWERPLTVHSELGQTRTRTDGVMIQLPPRPRALVLASTPSFDASTSTHPPIHPDASQRDSMFIVIRDPLPPPPGFSSKLIFALKTGNDVIPLPFRPQQDNR